MLAHGLRMNSLQRGGNKIPSHRRRFATQVKYEDKLDYTTNVTSGMTKPVWYEGKGSQLPKFEPLSQDASTDVVIIGAGIAGITNAYLLAKSGKSVTVLDDGEFVNAGETGRTTAHIFNALDDRYHTIQSYFGKEDTKLAAQSHTDAIETISKIVAAEKINCDFSRLDGYLIVGEECDPKELDKELQAAKESGVQVEMVDSAPHLKSDGRAIKFPGQAQFHINEYIAGLTQACVKMGVKFHLKTHVKEIEGGDKAHVKSVEGFTVHAKHIVEATNVPISDRFTMYLKMKPYRSYALAAPVPKGSVPRNLWWDTSDPYNYARITSLNDKHDSLIVGGQDHPVGQAHDFEKRFYLLEQWAKKRFPEMGPVSHKWSGQVTEPHDGLAFLGKNPGDKGNVYIITGDSGQGMTHCTLGAMIITDLINEKENKYAKLYDPSRKTLHALKETITENLNTQAQYKDWIAPADVSDVSKIPRGSGAIIQTGITKTAVYVDENGTPRACSAICPHLGGIVNWNDKEKTWDCPVHGSRFNKFGLPINGPCKHGLAPKEL